MVLVTRRWLLLASLGAPFAAALDAQSLVVRMDGNYVHIFAPSLTFLTGKGLAKLKDGSSIAFLGQLSISTDANRTVQARTIARFAMSYDIWEEKFSVMRFALNASAEEAPRKSTHASAASLQAWCLENLVVDVSQFALNQSIWVRLEIRAEDLRDGAGVIGDPGINISRLIELFSRPARPQQDKWQLDAGPILLRDLRKS
jgi:hypothetical protein